MALAERQVKLVWLACKCTQTRGRTRRWTRRRKRRWTRRWTRPRIRIRRWKINASE